MNKDLEEKILNFLANKGRKKSELESYKEEIVYMLRLNSSLKSIYDFLKQEYNIKTSYSNFHSFIKKNFGTNKNRKNKNNF
ncbi:MAG: hypothetical protein SOW25_08135 [Helicobacter sp.]|nr:hypothetical protein [Helicobacteraceae bacterium]MDY3114273.1 hypothetical protein [Helicobacter sp.]